jgi:hypothetical protein
VYFSAGKLGLLGFAWLGHVTGSSISMPPQQR